MINPLFTSKTNQQGFTLVELISALVILGTVIVVAIPHYLNLISDVGNSAAMQAVAEGKARLNHQYAIMLLSNDPDANKLEAIAAGANTTAGDYELIFTVSMDGKEVEVKSRGLRTGVSGEASGKWSIDRQDS